MLASTLDDLGDMAGALAGYERYIAAKGAISEFARVERAKLLARLSRSVEAEAAAQEVLTSGLLPDFKASFTLSMGKAFEQGADDASARAWYERAQTIDGGDVASALARIGRLTSDWATRRGRSCTSRRLRRIRRAASRRTCSMNWTPRRFR
jgi:hypothetical protein